MSGSRNPTLPFHVTSYDLLKSLAVILMVVDHLGSYFFHELMWLRALGRLCVPIWFFLAGYSRSQRLSGDFWLGAILLTATEVGFGRIPLPLNILFSICFIRLILGRFMKFAGNRVDYLYGAMGLCMLAFPFTDVVFEYGTLGFILAMTGYIVRHREDYKQDFVYGWAALSLGCFLGGTYIQFQFSALQYLFIATFSVFIMGMLACRPPQQETRYPKLDAQPLLKRSLQFMGRYTLHIYVAHLMLFKIILFS